MAHTRYPPNIKDCKKWFCRGGLSSTLDSNLCLFSNTHSSPLYPPKYYIAAFRNCTGLPKPIMLSSPLSLSRRCSLGPHYPTLLSPQVSVWPCFPTPTPRRRACARYSGAAHHLRVLTHTTCSSSASPLGCTLVSVKPEFVCHHRLAPSRSHVIYKYMLNKWERITLVLDVRNTQMQKLSSNRHTFERQIC